MWCLQLRARWPSSDATCAGDLCRGCAQTSDHRRSLQACGRMRKSAAPSVGAPLAHICSWPRARNALCVVALMLPARGDQARKGELLVRADVGTAMLATATSPVWLRCNLRERPDRRARDDSASLALTPSLRPSDQSRHTKCWRRRAD